MKKIDEIRDPNSCLNKAKDDEPVFVLLARDKAAEMTVRYWMMVRTFLKIDEKCDAKQSEAWDCATAMKEWREKWLQDTTKQPLEAGSTKSKDTEKI